MVPRYCSTCGSPVALAEETTGKQLRVLCPECGAQAGPRPGVLAAGILARDGDAGPEVLLIRRRPSAAFAPGQYCLPGKLVEWREDARDAIVRAFWELTGLRVQVGAAFDVHSCFEHPRDQRVIAAFRVQAAGQTPLAGANADEVGFFPLANLPDLATSTERLILERLLREGNVTESAPRPDHSAQLHRSKRKYRELLEAYTNELMRGAWINDLHLRLSKETSTAAITSLAAQQLVERTEVNEVRMWYAGPPDRCESCPWADRCAKERCLHLVAHAMGGSSDYSEMILTDSGQRIPKRPQAAEQRIPLLHGVPAGEVALKNEVIRAELPGAGATPRRFEGFPLETGDRVPGVLGLISRTPMDSNARRLFEVVARHIGTLVRNARLVDDLRLANQVKLGFIGRMSHELKTPLTAILGYSELLREELLEEGHTMGADGAATIEESGRKLLDIVESILEIAKLQSATVRFRRTRFDMLEVIEERLPKYRKRASDKVAPASMGRRGEEGESPKQGVEVEFIPPPPDAPPFGVFADRQRVHQVLDQLLDNAIKFTPNGGSIKIELRAEGEQVVCTVRDTGIGIAPEHQRMIFEPFQQVSEKIHLDYGGLGIGLALVKELVEQQGGRVWVDSHADQGSAFHFSLPTFAKSV